MCTIVALRGVRSDCPLILATNRDEFFARESSGPVELLAEPSTVGGRDLRASGTWMGVTRAGLFVGVTNHRRFEPPDPLRRSRGEVVLHALSLGSPRAVTDYVRTLDGREYNSFNLLWGDATELLVGYARDQRELEVEPVPEGVHVLPNDRLDCPDFAKVARARRLVDAVLTEDRAQDCNPQDRTALRVGLQTMLADRQLPALSDIPEPPAGTPLTRALLRELGALCVRTPAYGTRSSTVVMLQPQRVAEYWYADGPPDRAPFIDVLPLFQRS